MKIFEKGIVKLLVPDEWNCDYDGWKTLTIEVGDNHKLEVTRNDEKWTFTYPNGKIRTYENDREFIDLIRLDLSKFYEPECYLRISHWRDGDLYRRIYTKTMLQEYIYSCIEEHAQDDFCADECDDEYYQYIRLNLSHIQYYMDLEEKYQYLFGESYIQHIYNVSDDKKIYEISKEEYFNLLRDEIHIQQQLDEFYGVPL